MATAKMFEDLEAWQLAREIADDINNETLLFPFAQDFDLKDQIRRSSGSAMDDIAEGFERGGRKEFIQFLGIAKGSIGETRSQLYRALDRKHITRERFDFLYGKVIHLSKMISNFISYLKGSNYKGFKFD